jgi:hypothetical protein
MFTALMLIALGCSLYATLFSPFKKMALPLATLMWSSLNLFFLWWNARMIPSICPPEAVRDAWLAQRLCPSCAYPLHEDISDGTSHQTCSECGARWVVPAPAQR